MKKSAETVAVIGASRKEDRYSNKAVRQLMQHNHTVLPVNPVEKTIEGLKVFGKISEISVNVDTVTMYVNPNEGLKLKEELLLLRPKRVIFNPGTENQELIDFLERNGVACLRACTLVLLSTGQF